MSSEQHQLSPNRRYWLGFSLIPEIGPRRFALLLQAFGDAAQAWHASESQLRRAGLEAQPTANLLQHRTKLNLDDELKKIERAGATFITQADAAYPPALRDVPGAPIVLYVRGSLLPADGRALAIVGTRKATTYGRSVTHRLASELAAVGVTIISGLAQGVDAAAHAGALEARGRTIAILGCGIDQVYPREHADLARQVAAQGAVVSEFPIGTRPDARNFPRRNRIISGMSLGVLITEAPEHSGALITATLAAEQGREVFAVPGNINSPASTGTNRLLQDGAAVVLKADDILDVLDAALYRVQPRVDARSMPTPAASMHDDRADAPRGEIRSRVSTDDVENQLLGHLSAQPMHIDDLARLSGQPIAAVSGMLTILELKGLVQMVAPMQYSRFE